MIGFSAAVGRVGPISGSSTSNKLRSDNSLGVSQLFLLR